MDGATVTIDAIAMSQGVFDRAVPRIDLHMHTTWTDGQNSVREMYDAALASRLDAILFSEHARQTSEDWFFTFAAEVRSLPPTGCVPLVGVEAKVAKFDGHIDSTPGIVGAADLVMASVHRFPGEKRTDGVREFEHVDPGIAIDTERRLMLAVLENPDVDILGHPFGVSLNRFKLAPSEDDFRAVIEKAAKTRVAFEINSYYHRAPWELIRWCREAGARVSLGSNAHHAHEVGAVVRTLENGGGA